MIQNRAAILTLSDKGARGEWDDERDLALAKCLGDK